MASKHHLIQTAFLLCVMAAKSGRLCRADQRVPRFERDVRPILIENCYQCHGSSKPRGGVDLRSVSFMIAPPAGGPPVLVPGSPEQSLIYHVLTNGRMPPTGPLSHQDVETVRAWITANCPADALDTIYGAAFYQRWGPILCIIGVLTLATQVYLSRGAASAGEIIVVLATLPVIGASVSALCWHPSDSLGIGVAATMGLGLLVGGAFIAAGEPKNAALGAGLALLGPLGLIVLAKMKGRPSSAEAVCNPGEDE